MNNTFELHQNSNETIPTINRLLVNGKFYLDYYRVFGTSTYIVYIHTDNGTQDQEDILEDLADLFKKDASMVGKTLDFSYRFDSNIGAWILSYKRLDIPEAARTKR